MPSQVPNPNRAPTPSPNQVPIPSQNPNYPNTRRARPSSLRARRNGRRARHRCRLPSRYDRASRLRQVEP